MVGPEGTKRISKIDTYLNVAEAFAYRSTCIKRKYGAVIVKDDVVISTGYNGSPRGYDNCCDLGVCPRIQLGMHQPVLFCFQDAACTLTGASEDASKNADIPIASPFLSILFFMIFPLCEVFYKFTGWKAIIPFILQMHEIRFWF